MLGNCECECDKSRGVGEYLDYAKCKCRKRLVGWMNAMQILMKK